MELKGKYKEFKYKITKTGYQLFHKHFTVCSGTLKMPFKEIKLDKPNPKDLHWMRRKVYSECEGLLKNPWWRKIDKKEKNKKEIKETIKKLDNYPLVQVKWLDAQTGFSQLMPISEFKKDFKPFYNYSFGYLLEDNKEHIILGFLLMDSEIVDEETGVKHWQLIPKGMVKEINRISSP